MEKMEFELTESQQKQLKKAGGIEGLLSKLRETEQYLPIKKSMSHEQIEEVLEQNDIFRKEPALYKTYKSADLEDSLKQVAVDLRLSEASYRKLVDSTLERSLAEAKRFENVTVDDTIKKTVNDSINSLTDEVKDNFTEDHKKIIATYLSAQKQTVNNDGDGIGDNATSSEAHVSNNSSVIDGILSNDEPEDITPNNPFVSTAQPGAMTAEQKLEAVIKEAKTVNERANRK